MSKDRLFKYREKRNFSKTKEPAGLADTAVGNGYVIQKHAASHLHYDFRLELDGVLKSWAVPKGPSLDPHDKRLAMEVEDHPAAYGNFEGTIPKGEYGGGAVMLWDRGTWEPIGDPRDGLKKGKLVFRLHGERLTGEWTLIRFKGKEGEKHPWFLIKHRDDLVVEGDNGSFLDENPTSVVSGRTMDAIAADKDHVWQSKPKKTASGKAAISTLAKPSRRFSGARVRRADFPGFISPQLATLSSSLPKGENWVHEIKLDGYRMAAYAEDGQVRLISRNGKDWTTSFQRIADTLAALPVKNIVCDGEVVVMNDNDRSSFNDLKNALSAGDDARIQYYLFDLLFCNDEDLRELPLIERKARLAALIKRLPAKARNRLHYSEHFTDDDGVFLQGVCSMHLEGVVSKRADAPYVSHRTKTWLKTKCIKREEFVIGGYTLPSNGSKGIGALLLGYYDDDRFKYAGRVGTGWNASVSSDLRSRLEKLKVPKSSYESVTMEEKHGAVWVKPTLVCEVEFTEWTPDGHLRHPSFQGLREDKPAKDVMRDFAEPVARAQKEAEREVSESRKQTASFAEMHVKPPTKLPAARAASLNAKGTVEWDGITITHPDRIIFPDSGITKGQLGEYYARVADSVLPYVENRPLSVLRCPAGTAEPCFFQRHVGAGNTPYIKEVTIPVNGEDHAYMMIGDVQGLLSLVQWGVIELHTWQCSASNFAKPDRLVFDLDPDPAVPWRLMIDAANEVRLRMEELGLISFLKTTGGKGLHVVVPFTTAYGWTTIKSFTRAIAASMAHDNPNRYIATMGKAARKGKIFVDYLRNDVTSTAVAPFSVRARIGATVSMPLAWEELTDKLSPTAITIDTVPGQLQKRKKDPWQAFLHVKQKIAAKYIRALKIDF